MRAKSISMPSATISRIVIWSPRWSSAHALCQASQLIEDEVLSVAPDEQRSHRIAQERRRIASAPLAIGADGRRSLCRDARRHQK